MTTNTAEKGAKSTAAASTKADEVTENYTRVEFNRTLAIVKMEIGSLVQDASRKNPLFSKDAETAQAKANAIQKSFAEFVAMARSLKDEG